jgi:uncharacterized protein YodC (DUF2158 family)
MTDTGMSPASEDLKIMASGKEFKVGDIVKLKSGGPDMTVEGWNAYHGAYDCQWFAGKKLDTGLFKFESLELVTSGKS